MQNHRLGKFKIKFQVTASGKRIESPKVTTRVERFEWEYQPGIERVHALVDISSSRYVVIAIKPVHQLQIRPTVHN